MKRVFIACVFLAAAILTHAEDSKLDAVSAYSRWVKPWSEHATNSVRLDGAGLKLVVTTISGEQPLSVVTNLTAVERLNLAYHLKTAGTEISTNGLCWSYFASNTDSREAPARQLSEDELKRLDDLLASLPDDDLKLPPPGRRIVVQVFEQDHWKIRVYDGNSAPPEVLSLLALIGNPFDKSL
jgi:hypothetical protein